MHQKLLDIRTYNNENGNTLFKYSIEFELLVNMLIKTGNPKFLFIHNNYNKDAQNFYQLCGECYDEKTGVKRFLLGSVNYSFIRVNA